MSTGGNLGIQAGSIQIGGAVLVAHDMQLQASDIAVNARLHVGYDYSASAGNSLVQDGNTTVGNSASLQAKAVTLGGNLTAPQTRITGASLIDGTSGATSITGKLLADLRDRSRSATRWTYKATPASPALATKPSRRPSTPRVH